ncbi:arabinose-binding AraC family transcriptional regulator [Oleiphilus messinensis]|uniref:Arabinose-binding AraC family transcriptional regulator n=1 Tax=Oleiphilus messinensis TaxID=141451 RepID=A0A1Y0IAY5_9GAMM|nr:AraC family transcriptional regulator [Oleiphilus messinensis]ARU57410.1 arabinose-binding AraC family transcriptional regulator [Oleiphilus messinensis]
MTIDYDSKIMSASYAAVIVRLVKQYGITESAMLENTGIPQALLSADDQYLSVNQFVRLTHNALTLTGVPHLGLKLGQNLNVTAHGMMGIAALSSKNTREVLEVIHQYIRTRFNLISAEYDVHNGVFSLIIEEDDDAVVSLKQDPNADVAFRFALEAIFASIHSIVQLLTQTNCQELQFEFAFPVPFYLAEYQRVFGSEVRFGQKQHRITGPEAFADLPFSFYDEATLQAALRSCQSLLAGLPVPGVLMTTRVRNVLDVSNGNFLTFDELCKRFNMSSRTMRRRLESEGTNYQEIVNAARLELAKKYLSDTTMSIIAVASELKFSDPSYFARIFKRWTGLSPSQYRQKYFEANKS